jgi:putative component of toxin-antitoxin plasmid stabilization module
MVMLEVLKSATFGAWFTGLRDQERTQDADIKRAIEIAKDWKG